MGELFKSQLKYNLTDVHRLLIVDDLDGWPEETPRDVSDYIFPFENTTLIFPRILNRLEADKTMLVTILLN